MKVELFIESLRGNVRSFEFGGHVFNFRRDEIVLKLLFCDQVVSWNRLLLSFVSVQN